MCYTLSMNNDNTTQKPSDHTPGGIIEIPLETLDEVNNESPLSPAEADELGVSGTTPDPESDDNMLDNAQDVGLYTDSNEEEPVELNIADQIEKAEKYHHDH